MLNWVGFSNGLSQAFDQNHEQFLLLTEQMDFHSMQVKHLIKIMAKFSLLTEHMGKFMGTVP